MIDKIFILKSAGCYGHLLRHNFNKYFFIYQILVAKGDTSEDEPDGPAATSKRSSKIHTIHHKKDNFKLAKEGDFQLLEQVSNEEVNKQDKDTKMTLLHYTVRFFNYNLALELINKKNAQFNIPGPDDQTAFHYLCKYNNDKDDPKKSELTNKMFEDEEVIRMRDKFDKCGLYLAAQIGNEEIVKCLIEFFDNSNHNWDGEIANFVWEAAVNGQFQLLKNLKEEILLKEGRKEIFTCIIKKYSQF